jgi:hypothetical protein
VFLADLSAEQSMIPYKPSILRWILLIIPILVLSVSCEPAVTGRDTPPPSTPEGEISFETILIDAPLGDDPVDSAYLVITEPSQLEQLQGVIPDSALTAGKSFAGWDSNLILIVFSGVKGSSGYGIQIDSITAADNRWTVFVTETRPSAEQIVEPARTMPFALIQVSKGYLLGGDQLVVEFIDQERKVLSTSEISIP